VEETKEPEQAHPLCKREQEQEQEPEELEGLAQGQKPESEDREEDDGVCQQGPPLTQSKPFPARQAPLQRGSRRQSQ